MAQFEAYYAKTGFMIFFSVIPKEGLIAINPAKPSFVMTLTQELYSVVFTDYYSLSVSLLSSQIFIVDVIPKDC